MKLFVWDFHGVLERGNERAVTVVSNIVLGQAGYIQKLSDDDCIRLYGRKWYEYFEDVLPEEPRTAHLALQAAAFGYSLAHPEIIAEHIEPTPYSHEVLRGIEQAGHQNLLISNTQPSGLEVFLRSVDVRKFFPDGNAIAVYAHDPDSMKSKEEVLQRYLEGRQFDGFVIIGDSPSDMALVDVCGGTTIHYTHPYMPRRECPADHRIDDLREVLRHC